MIYLTRCTLVTLAAIAIVACSSGATPVGVDDEHGTSGADGGRQDATADGGSCGVIQASSYTNTCTVDSDCVAVPPGGNTCDVCSAGSGDWSCSIVALPKAAAATYTSALSAGLAPLKGTMKYDECVVQSCPIQQSAGCVEGACAIVSGRDSGAPDGGRQDAKADGASCGVVQASSYTNTCTVDTDCTAVPPGGNTCDLCSAGSGDWSCDLAALPNAAAATYTSALSAALSPLKGTPDYDQCVIQSCPVAQSISCVKGACAIVPGGDSGM